MPLSKRTPYFYISFSYWCTIGLCREFSGYQGSPGSFCLPNPTEDILPLPLTLPQVISPQGKLAASEISESPKLPCYAPLCLKVSRTAYCQEEPKENTKTGSSFWVQES